MLKRIYIEISNICNVQCSFCPVVEKDKRRMSLEEFENTLLQALPLAQEVCLHLLGEPLAHPQFSEILDICHKHNAKVQLTTNGLMLERNKEVLLKSHSLRQINFSLQAFTDNFPNRNLEDYLRPIMNFTKELHHTSPFVYVNYRMWNQESQDSDNSNFFKLIENFFNIKINPNIEIGAIKSKKIWNLLYLHFDSRFEWPSLELPLQGTQGRCNGVLQHVGIHADGTVVPCCLDKDAEINLGNCHQEKLGDILKNDRTKAMANGFSNGILVEKLCQHCSYINRFKKN